MRIVISLALFRIMPSSSVIVLGNMVGRVMKVWGCWGVGGVSENDMRSGEDDLTDIFLFVIITNKLSTHPS